MSEPAMSAELEMAGRVLDLVRSAAGPGAEAEVAVDRESLALTRFANSFIHQNVADDTTRVRLRLHLDGRTTTAGTTVVSGDGLADLVNRTVAASRLAPVDPGWPGVAPAPPEASARPGASASPGASAPPDGSGPPHGSGSGELPEPVEFATRIRSFVDAAGGLETAGYIRAVHASGGFANSAGRTSSGYTTQAAMDGIARLSGADGVARRAGTTLSDLDGAILGARAAAKARAAADPVELPPGRYEVVLEPAAVADLLHNLAVWGFNGKAFTERRSFVALGETQFDTSVTIVDEPIALPYDVEGTPKRRVVYVDGGVTATVAHDRRTAIRVGAESNGNALADTGPWGPFPVNLGLTPRPGPAGPATDPATAPSEVDGPIADSAVAELVAGVVHGVLVTDFWYTRVLDPKTLAVTGLTRNGVWLIENGQITRPVRNFRFTQAYPRALGPGAVLGIGSHADPQPDTWTFARWAAPALHLASWNFTGGASG